MGMIVGRKGRGGREREREGQEGASMNLRVEAMATVQSARVKVDHLFVTDDARSILVIVGGGHYWRVSNGHLLARPAGRP